MLEMILSFLISLVAKLGIIDDVKSKFVATPDLARDELNAVLSKVEDIFSMILGMTRDYLNLYFDETTLQDNRKILLHIESGELAPQVEKARQHCYMIENIYNKHLRTVFAQVLSKEEQVKMEELFQELSKKDGGLVDNLHQLAQWLASEAQITLDLVDEGNLAAANGRIRDARKREDMKLIRDEAIKTMNSLYQHQNDIAKQTIK